MGGPSQTPFPPLFQYIAAREWRGRAPVVLVQRNRAPYAPPPPSREGGGLAIVSGYSKMKQRLSYACSLQAGSVCLFFAVFSFPVALFYPVLTCPPPPPCPAPPLVFPPGGGGGSPGVGQDRGEHPAMLSGSTQAPAPVQVIFMRIRHIEFLYSRSVPGSSRPLRMCRMRGSCGLKAQHDDPERTSMPSVVRMRLWD